jgi:hypothetical protein
MELKPKMSKLRYTWTAPVEITGIGRTLKMYGEVEV